MDNTKLLAAAAVLDNSGAPVEPRRQEPLSVDDLAKRLGVSAKYLWYLAYNTDKLYKKLEIPKGNGKKRVVYDPAPQLKFVLRRLQKRVLAQENTPAHVGAYVKSRSCRHTAEQHCNKKVIISLDLSDFFDSTDQWAVSKALQSQLHVTKRAAHLIAKLCTYQKRTPQGSPTSGDLCNLVAMDTLDKEIAGLLCLLRGSTRHMSCSNLVDTIGPSLGVTGYKFPKGATYTLGRRVVDVDILANALIGGPVRQYLGDRVSTNVVYKFPDVPFTYTRYSDDIDISTNANLPRYAVDWIINKVSRICKRHGYDINKKKTKVERAGGRQVVLGMVVNAHPNVPKSQYLKYRAMVHNCLTHGFDSQAGRAGYTNGFQLYAHLLGMINYMGQVNPAKKEKLIGKLEEAKEKWTAELEI